MGWLMGLLGGEGHWYAEGRRSALRVGMGAGMGTGEPVRAERRHRTGPAGQPRWLRQTRLRQPSARRKGGTGVRTTRRVRGVCGEGRGKKPRGVASAGDGTTRGRDTHVVDVATGHEYGHGPSQPQAGRGAPGLSADPVRCAATPSARCSDRRSEMRTSPVSAPWWRALSRRSPRLGAGEGVHPVYEADTSSRGRERLSRA